MYITGMQKVMKYRHKTIIAEKKEKISKRGCASRRTAILKPPLAAAPVCPFEKGFILDDDDRCICPAERGFYVDENGNCARCPVELGFVLTEDGLCICDPEKGYVLTRAGTCDCPLPAEKDEDGDCVGAWSPRG